MMVTIVPEKRQELTTEVVVSMLQANHKKLKQVVESLRSAGIGQSVC